MSGVLPYKQILVSMKSSKLFDMVNVERFSQDDHAAHVALFTLDDRG